MPVPSSGPVAISDLVDEFGGTAPHSMSEYYRNGVNVPSNNTNVPTSGAFGLSNARGAVNEIAIAATSGTNIDISSLFGGNWTSTIPKRLTIGSGVTIGGTGSSAAIIIPSNMAGTLEIDNAGTVIGFGGASAGAAGGDAINNAVSGVTINNTGQISGGGGAGANGSVGGNGSSSTTVQGTESRNDANHRVFYDNENGYAYRWGGSVVSFPTCNACYLAGSTFTNNGEYNSTITRHGPVTTTTSTTGGAGGTFGLGAGYNQSATSGTAGAAGGTNAGTGSSGTNGGALGTAASNSAAGANGNVTSGAAGQSGGAAGAAVTGTSVTMNNTGTLHGAVA